jgi:predicted dinucleotide-binding enzyme
MRVGIIGAGGIGRTVGGLLHGAGHQILVSWASSDVRLGEAADAIGAGTQTGTPAEAVSFATSWCSHLASSTSSRPARRSAPLPARS